VILLAAALGWCIAGAMALELRRRSALLADAAHELRGPVTALSLGLEALRRQPVLRRRADALLVELARMHAATDDVAAAARGRRAEGVRRSFDLRHLAESGGEAWRLPAQRRGGRILVDWDADAARVETDPRRLSQALGNVLSNAVEHGGGEVVVRGRSEPGRVRVEIADRGANPEAAAPSREGRGRGLRIAKRAIEDAGGTLGWRDRPHGGRAVVLELPVAGSDRSLDPAMARPSDQSAS
jgi:signal transduction histidine kinase